MMAQAQQSAFLASKKQEGAANHYCPHASPNWDVDRLLFLNRHLYRAQLHRMSLPEVAETAIHQRQHTGNNQHDRQNLD